MKAQRVRDAASLVAATAVSVLGMALIGEGCSQPSRDSPAPLTRATVVPARTASSTELPGAGDATTVTDTNAGPGGAAGVGDTIAGRIDAAIIHDTQMTGSRVAAVVDAGGVATLNGTVQNAQQKALAEKAAKDTPGVVSLKDKLEIRPTGGAAESVQRSQASGGRVTSLTVGDVSDTSAGSNRGVGNAGSAGANASPPRVVVVNNYVPVPGQQVADGNDNSPYGVYGGYGDDSSVSGSGYYGNAENGYGNSYGYAGGYSNAPNGQPGVLNSDVVPGYLRDMANANDYENYTRDNGQY